MSEAKHTPGPWYYIKDDEWSHSVVTRHGELPDGSPNYWTVASVNKRREPEHEANASLIAAAPDLLDALKGALNHWAVPSSICIDRPAYEKARAAIAKATGQKQ